MRGARSLLLMLPLTLAAGGCMRSTQSYIVYDPNTGQQYTTTALPQQAYPQYQQRSRASSFTARAAAGELRAARLRAAKLRANLAGSRASRRPRQSVRESARRYSQSRPVHRAPLVELTRRRSKFSSLTSCNTAPAVTRSRSLMPRHTQPRPTQPRRATPRRSRPRLTAMPRPRPIRRLTRSTPATNCASSCSARKA